MRRLRPLTARLRREPVRLQQVAVSPLGAEEIKIEKLHIGGHQHLGKIPNIELKL